MTVDNITSKPKKKDKSLESSYRSLMRTPHYYPYNYQNPSQPLPKSNSSDRIEREREEKDIELRNCSKLLNKLQ